MRPDEVRTRGPREPARTLPSEKGDAAPMDREQEGSDFHPSQLDLAQASAIQALEILECVQVLLHSVEEDDEPARTHRLCSGAYEIVQMVHSHISDVSKVLSKAVEAAEARARS